MSDVVVQRACSDPAPDDVALTRWAAAVLESFNNSDEVTLRLVGADEMQTLNRTYRDKDKLTNVLSFPADAQVRELHNLLGDVVICPDVVNAEAQQQNKSADAHYAHLVVHGILHLLGYDHIEEHDANEMEALETRTLATFGISDPYVDHVANAS